MTETRHYWYSPARHRNSLLWGPWPAEKQRTHIMILPEGWLANISSETNAAPVTHVNDLIYRGQYSEAEIKYRKISEVPIPKEK